LEKDVQTRSASSPDERPLKDLYLRIANGALAADAVEDSASDIGTFSAKWGLFEQATEIASMFWAHDAENVKNLIDHVTAAVADTPTELLRTVMTLASEVSDLQALQALLVGIDRRNPKRLLAGLAFNWNSTHARAAISSIVEPVASLLDLVTSPLEDGNNRDASELALQLAARWTGVRDTLDPVFGTIFPSVYTVVDTAWQSFERLTGLPRRVAMPPVWNVAKTDRAFIPEAVLARFLGVAMQNLRTAAFAGASDFEGRTASVEVGRATDNWGQSVIDISLCDNGLKFKPTETSPQPEGHHLGLEDLRTMVPWFGAEIIGPTFDYVNTETKVTLRSRKYK
jgi:hypothetical protein